MRNMKKALLLAISLLFMVAAISCLTMVSYAADFNDGDFGYNYIWDDNYKRIGLNLVEYTGSATTISIPDTVSCTYEAEDEVTYETIEVTNDLPVTTIGFYVFEDNKSVSCVRVPAGLTTIEAGAFYGCISLRTLTVNTSTATGTINIPEGVTLVDENAFRGCRSITSVVFPSTMTEIKYCCFEECNSLQNVDMSKNTITVIGDCAFKSCASLKGVTLPEALVSLGREVFCHCTALKSMDLPATVTSIGEELFYNCTALDDISLSSNISYIPAGIFYNCTALKNITIPSGVVLIDSEMFYYCSKLALVRYNGTIAQWKQVIVQEGNENLDKALIRCTDGNYHKVHTYKSATTKATTSKDGKIVKTCELCGKVGSTTVIPKASSMKLSTTKYTYNGETKLPAVTVKDSKGKELKLGTDYTVAYKNNTKIGTATATVTLKGNYTGSKALTYSIVPGKVSGVKATAQTTSTITLTWKKVAGAKSYKVYDYNTKTKEYKTVATVTTTTATVKKLKSGTAYSFVVTAFAGEIKGTGSTALKAATLPAKVTGLKASSQTTTTLKLSWTKVAGATSYNVYTYTSSTKKYKKIATVKTNSLKVTGLKAGTDYKFAVKAVANSLTGAYSSLLTTGTKTATPSIKVTSTAKKSATVSWGKVTGASSYVVYYATSKNGTYKKLATVTGTSYTYKKLTSGKTAYFKVMAINTAGSTTINSSYSAVKSVKVK